MSYKKGDTQKNKNKIWSQPEPCIPVQTWAIHISNWVAAAQFISPLYCCALLFSFWLQDIFWSWINTSETWQTCTGVSDTEFLPSWISPWSWAQLEHLCCPKLSPDEELENEQRRRIKRRDTASKCHIRCFWWSSQLLCTAFKLYSVFVLRRHKICQKEEVCVQNANKDLALNGVPILRGSISWLVHIYTINQCTGKKKVLRCMWMDK